MRHLLSLFLLFVGTVGLHAVDLAAISANPSREALTGRFVAGDSTLTPDELTTVYYGALFAPGYASLPASYDTINELRSQRRYAEMMPLCRKALEADPTNLTLLFRTFAAAFNTHDDAVRDNAGLRVNQMCDAIYRSGTGVREDSPFEVTTDSDIAQFLTNFLQVDSIVETARQGELTVAKVMLPGREEPAYLYFRVARP